MSPSVGIGALLIEGEMSEPTGQRNSNSIPSFAKSDADSSSPAPMREETHHTVSERRYRRAADRRRDERTCPPAERAFSPGGHVFAHALKQAIQRSIEDLVLLDHPQVPARRNSNRLRIR